MHFISKFIHLHLLFFVFQCTSANAENMKTEMIILKLHVGKCYARTNRLRLVNYMSLPYITFPWQI